MRFNYKGYEIAGESLREMVASMEGAGYIYTTFTDDGQDDYEMLRSVLAGKDASGFSVDLHVLFQVTKRLCLTSERQHRNKNE